MASQLAPLLTTPKTSAATVAQIQAQFSALYAMLGDSGRTIQPLPPSLAQWQGIQTSAQNLAALLGLI